MKAITFQEFRAMQLAVIGACVIAGRGNKVTRLTLEGIDEIEVGDNAVINEISLHRDVVTLSICGAETDMPITMLSDDIIEEIIDTMRAKAVDIANCDIMVNGRGEWDKNEVRL